MNSEVKGEKKLLNKVLPMYCGSGNVWNPILNSRLLFLPCFRVLSALCCPNSLFQSCPHSSTLDYVIRYEILNPSCITQLPSNAKPCFRAPMTLSLWLSHLSCSFFVFDSVLSQSNLITDLITLKIDFHFENPNRGKRWLRLLALFLLNEGFYRFREIQRKYMKK